MKLPDRTGNAALADVQRGHPDIAVGAGAVWARNPDEHDLAASTPRPASSSRRSTSSREPDDRRRTREGVWIVGGLDNAVTRIDPRTNRVGADGSELGSRRHVGDRRRRRHGLGDVATRGRAVADRAGAAADHAVDRRRARRRRTSPTATGAAWIGNYIDGTVSRIDPRTNKVTARPGRRGAGARGRRRRRRGSAPRAGPRAGSPAGGGLRRARVRRQEARRADRLRPAAPGPEGAGPARDGRRDPPRARASTTSRRAGSASATTPATSRPRRPAASSSAGAPRTRTRTRAPTSSWR